MLYFKDNGAGPVDFGTMDLYAVSKADAYTQVYAKDPAAVGVLSVEGWDDLQDYERKEIIKRQKKELKAERRAEKMKRKQQKRGLRNGTNRG